ncbi:LysR family transcriptional regulator [Novimethylophilus kurashikiensis]|uniref:LysR family transcriptional regulator n=1 Tax=Novimethylophilus kurashikiensis TaxID=1825523 RepID=A0A2R5F1J2_9PROT|nr:DUF2721 domain-containing protein [Novimethylophilus kurashikiensis]GBG12576.1 LysR family transcriptional regulator [Novimethylophilus kurashikiensis]
MEFATKDFMNAIGPPAAIVFASWIFMTFLQQRYIAAFDRFRSLIASYRDQKLSDDRRKNLKQQIFMYKERCNLMKTATNIGLFAAMFLLLALICAALDTMFPGMPIFKHILSFSALIGLGLVMVAAGYVVRENNLLQGALNSEISDIPDLEDANKHRP